MWWFIGILFVACGLAAQDEQLLVAAPGSPVASRIIGGAATTIEKYPYTVQVLYNGNLICGGSLLTTRHVLSAGHCFVNSESQVLSPALFSARVGSTYLDAGGSVHAASALAVHERYNNPARDNDIAVLVLSSPVSYSDAVQPAYIPPQGYVVPDDVDVVHVGWGLTDATVNVLSPVLNEVTVRIVNRTTCAERYALLEQYFGEPYPISDSMICAGLLDVGGADACQGDSGGPLVFQGVVVGATSWGLGCAEPLFPGVNCRIASYTDWINETVTRYSKGPPTQAVNAILLSSLLVSSAFIVQKV